MTVAGHGLAARVPLGKGMLVGHQIKLAQKKLVVAGVAQVGLVLPLLRALVEQAVTVDLGYSCQSVDQHNIMLVEVEVALGTVLELLQALVDQVLGVMDHYILHQQQQHLAHHTLGLVGEVAHTT